VRAVQPVPHATKDAAGDNDNSDGQTQ